MLFFINVVFRKMAFFYNSLPSKFSLLHIKMEEVSNWVIFFTICRKHLKDSSLIKNRVRNQLFISLFKSTLERVIKNECFYKKG